jgi:hypothetical protein
MACCPIDFNGRGVCEGNRHGFLEAQSDIGAFIDREQLFSQVCNYGCCKRLEGLERRRLDGLDAPL